MLKLSLSLWRCWVSCCWVTIRYPKQQPLTPYHTLLVTLSGGQDSICTSLYCVGYQNTDNFNGSLLAMIMFMTEKRDLINLLALGAVHTSVSLMWGESEEGTTRSISNHPSSLQASYITQIDADICERNHCSPGC